MLFGKISGVSPPRPPRDFTRLDNEMDKALEKDGKEQGLTRAPGFGLWLAQRFAETHAAEEQLRGELPVGKSLARAYGSIETLVSRVLDGAFAFAK